ncbi:proton channel OtopLc-like isoform X1 [Ostrinia furnacalis]|uniref:proton channel OtopLc-like isoform X1 n=1 Tax=Ostrinia furnacalis TaxID=93504 RepID=UPI00103E2E8C|nr:proton channel OtopLc-like isoform X1 [Ostrinia furnacalis]
MEDVIEEEVEWHGEQRSRHPANTEHYEHGLHHYHPHRQTSTSLERKIRHNREHPHPPHSLPRLSVVPPASNSSSTDNIAAPAPKPKRPLSHGDESMTVVLSAFYAKLLIVLGVALPVTSTIQNELYTNITSDIFTMYLYIISMAFLAYTFYHLRIAKKDLKKDNVKRTRYGSFYLHMGVAGFSVGSIIYSCLQFGGYFDLSGDCQLLIVAVKPALRILYMVAQTVFIFSYTDILDPMRGVVLDRFGLMHLIATNVCEWLNVVIQETRDDIVAVAYDRPALLRYANISGPAQTIIMDEVDNATFIEHLSLANITSNETTMRNWTCDVSDMITPLIRSVNPYLRPCGVEYSLLCSIIIAVIWNDICTVPGSKFTKKSNSSPQTFGIESRRCCARIKSNNHFSVDCGSAHKGLFMGVAVLAGTIVSLMLFNGLFQNQKHVELALLQVNVWETILFVLMTAGSGACIQRMRTLPARRAVAALPLEHALLLVTQCGVYLYYLFQIIGAGFLIQRYPEGRRATRILSPLCALVQSSCQTLLVLDAWSRRCAGAPGGRRPGRQLVTFLLVGNFALWLLNRVKNARAEFHPLQMEFYGVWAWTLITHVSVPLLVCYRFQATVCFYEIWKNSYKTNKDAIDVIAEDEFELKNYHLA